MMNRFHSWHIRVLLCLTAGLIFACGTTAPARFYVLSPLPGSTAIEPTSGMISRLSVGVEPVTLPGYLDRPQIVTRTGPHSVVPAEYDRWAEPLADNFQEVLVENLSHILYADQIAVSMRQNSKPVDYRVSVKVVRFDGELGGDVVLKARWTILKNQDNSIVLIKATGICQASGSPAYEAMVSAQSEVLADFSREIAVALKSVFP